MCEWVAMRDSRVVVGGGGWVMIWGPAAEAGAGAVDEDMMGWGEMGYAVSCAPVSCAPVSNVQCPMG